MDFPVLPIPIRPSRNKKVLPEINLTACHGHAAADVSWYRAPFRAARVCREGIDSPMRRRARFGRGRYLWRLRPERPL